MHLQLDMTQTTIDQSYIIIPIYEKMQLKKIKGHSTLGNCLMTNTEYETDFSCSINVGNRFYVYYNKKIIGHKEISIFL